MAFASTRLCQIYPFGFFHHHIIHCFSLLIIASGMKAVSIHLILKIISYCNYQTLLPQLLFWDPRAKRAASFRFQKRVSLIFSIFHDIFFYLKMLKEGISRPHRSDIVSVSRLLFCRDSSNTEIALHSQPQMVHLIRRGLWGSQNALSSQRRSTIHKIPRMAISFNSGDSFLGVALKLIACYAWPPHWFSPNKDDTGEMFSQIPSASKTKHWQTWLSKVTSYPRSIPLHY